MKLVEKVWRYILDQDLLQERDRVVVAVSGGPDSLCLLHILRSVASRLDLELAVAHLDHRIRPGSRQEAESVRKLAAAWSLLYEGAAADVPQYQAREGLSVEEAAREVRYKFLLKIAAKYRARKIAVGHHQDDQAETILLNILRGTGPDGLAGMPPKRAIGQVQLIRPLLAVTRTEIEEYCCDNGLQPLFDPSNLQTDYTRNRVRLELIPYLEEKFNPRLKESLARLASMAAADRRFLKDEAGKLFRIVARVRGRQVLIDRPALLRLPEALQGRIALLALERFVSRKQLGWQQVRQLLSMAKGRGSSGEKAFPDGVRAYLSYQHLVVSAAPRPHKTGLEARTLQIPGKTPLPGGSWLEARLAQPENLVWPPGTAQALLDYERIPGPLQVCGRWPGARFYPQGAPGCKKLKHFMIDQKVPRHRRDSYPLVTCGSEVIWVAGLRIAHPYRVTDQTRQVLILELKKPGTEYRI